jgi:hypothetical protein
MPEPYAPRRWKANRPRASIRTTFLTGFLWMSIPFVAAHGIFLAVLLGLVFGGGPGAVDREDLRIGIAATLSCRSGIRGCRRNG